MAQLRLFAAAREAAGTSGADIPGNTVAEVLVEATSRFGDRFAAVLAVSTVMVKGEATDLKLEDAVLVGPDDEIAVLPPVSGGAEVTSAHGESASPTDAVRVAILTVSDRAARGEYKDKTGPAIEMLLLTEKQFEIVEREILPDDSDAIADLLRWWCDQGEIDLVLTNGGTGLALRDVTPDATLRVIEREVPGLAEVMRAEGRAITPLASLSRQVVGQRGQTLLINLPGSPAGAVESLDAILGVIPHAISTMRVS